jgi:hypothetical protein
VTRPRGRVHQRHHHGELACSPIDGLFESQPQLRPSTVHAWVVIARRTRRDGRLRCPHARSGCRGGWTAVTSWGWRSVTGIGLWRCSGTSGRCEQQTRHDGYR